MGRRKKRKTCDSGLSECKKDTGLTDAKSDVFQLQKDLAENFLSENQIRRFIFSSDNSGYLEYMKMTTKKRIKTLIEKAGPKIDSENNLFHALNEKLARDLKRFYRTHFNQAAGVLVKSVIIFEILHRFYGRNQTPLERRKNEEENLEHFEEEEYKFLEICSILIPPEILEIILSYLPRSMEILTSVGSVCKTFYVSLLSSWSYVSVKNHSFHSIPLFVFRSVKSVYVSPCMDRQNLVKLWRNLSSNKSLKRIKFGHRIKKMDRSVDLMIRLKKRTAEKKKWGEKWVSSLSAAKNMKNQSLGDDQQKNQNLFSDRLESITTSMYSVKFLSFFPNVRTLHHFNNFADEGLLLSLSNLSRLEVLGVDCLRVEYEKEVLKKFTFPKIKKIFFVFGRSFKLDQHLEALLPQFPNVEVFSVKVSLKKSPKQRRNRSGASKETEILPLVQNLCPKLKTLYFFQPRSFELYHKRFHNTEKGLVRRMPIPVKYCTGLVLDELRIDSFGGNSVYRDRFDFNLEGMLQDGFFRKNKFRKLIIDVPLGNRRRNFNAENSPDEQVPLEFKNEVKVMLDFLGGVKRGDYSGLETLRMVITGRDTEMFKGMFFDESFLFCLDRKKSTMGGLKTKLKIIYYGFGCSDLGTWGNGKKEDLEKFLWENKEPCLILFLLFFQALPIFVSQKNEELEKTAVLRVLKEFVMLDSNVGRIIDLWRSKMKVLETEDRILDVLSDEGFDLELFEIETWSQWSERPVTKIKLSLCF